MALTDPTFAEAVDVAIGYVEGHDGLAGLGLRRDLERSARAYHPGKARILQIFDVIGRHLALSRSSDLDRVVSLSFPAAIQAVAALEDRIAMLHHDDEAWARRDAQSAVDAIREQFGIRKMTEAELDAAHEAAHIALDELRRADDIPLALATYWNRGS